MPITGRHLAARAMKILVSCLQSRKSHVIPAYGFWRTYFVRGLEEAGHQVVEVGEVDWAEGLTYSAGSALGSWRARTWERVLAFVREEQGRDPVQLFIGYLYPEQVDETAIQELQRMGIPCVNFFCDNVREFAGVPSEYRPFALHWVPEWEALPMYRAAGLAHVHAPMPCWIPPNLRNVPSRESEPPTFVGSADILRRDLLARALQAGADFTIRGPGWTGGMEMLDEERSRSRSLRTLLANQVTIVRRHGVAAILRKIENRVRPLPGVQILSSRIHEEPAGADEYMRVTREAMVTIGINRVPTARASHNRPLAYSRLRDIEASMLGACLLTEWTRGLETLFELETEIESYRTAEELSTKLAELRKYPARRLSMRRRGQLRALHDHSVACSIARICQKLGFPAKSLLRAGERHS
jgi:hypothetical protein